MSGHVFLSILAFTALSFVGCNEVVENTTTEPIPVGILDANVTYTQNQESAVADSKSSETSDFIVLPSEDVQSGNSSNTTDMLEESGVLSDASSNEILQEPELDSEDSIKEETTEEVVEVNNQNTTTSPTDKVVESSENCSDNPEGEIMGAAASLNDSSDLSASLLQTSKNLLLLSNSMMQAGGFANVEYMRSMYVLSQDILTMANRIGEMSNKILIMSDKIGDMSDRIIVTQNIQNENVALTQQNILKVQENFSYLLKLR